MAPVRSPLNRSSSVARRGPIGGGSGGGGGGGVFYWTLQWAAAAAPAPESPPADCRTEPVPLAAAFCAQCEASAAGDGPGPVPEGRAGRTDGNERRRQVGGTVTRKRAAGGTPSGQSEHRAATRRGPAVQCAGSQSYNTTDLSLTNIVSVERSIASTSNVQRERLSWIYKLCGTFISHKSTTIV